MKNTLKFELQIYTIFFKCQKNKSRVEKYNFDLKKT